MWTLPSAVARSAAQLRAEHRQVAQGQANAPQPQAGVALVFRPGHVGHLVGAQVEGADDHRLLAHRLDHAGIGLKMDFFGRLGFGAEIEELGAIQTHAVGPAIDAMIDLVGELDVAQEFDADAVAGFGRQIAQRLELGRLNAAFLFLAAIAGQRLFVRLEDYQPLVAVDDRQFAAGDFGEERPGAHDGGDFQGLGHDRRMAAGTAHLGDEAADEAAVEIRRSRWA